MSLLRASISYAGICIRIVALRILHPKKTYIGVLLAQHLGDIVAAEPIIGGLHEKYKEAEIFWIIRKPFADLLAYHPGIKGLIVEENLFVSIWLMKFSPFTQLFNLHLNDIRYEPNLSSVLENPKATELNITKENYYNNLSLLGIFSALCDLKVADRAPKLYVGDTQFTLPFGGNYWLMHRKSTDIAREWKDEHWIQLIDYLTKEHGINIVEIGIDSPLTCSNSQFLSLVGQTSILETAVLIRSAGFFLGIDSGPTHMANAFEIPAFIICGQFVNFKRYMSYSGAYTNKNIANIYFNPTGSAHELSYLEVLEALQNTLKEIKNLSSYGIII
jgi:heptosyltransferase-3